MTVTKCAIHLKLLRLMGILNLFRFSYLVGFFVFDFGARFHDVRRRMVLVSPTGFSQCLLGSLFIPYNYENIFARLLLDIDQRISHSLPFVHRLRKTNINILSSFYIDVHVITSK